MTIVNDHPRSWLTTYVDPTTRLRSIAGTVKVVTCKKFAKLACAVNPGKPSDSQGLVAVTVNCATASVPVDEPVVSFDTLTLVGEKWQGG